MAVLAQSRRTRTTTRSMAIAVLGFVAGSVALGCNAKQFVSMGRSKISLSRRTAARATSSNGDGAASISIPGAEDQLPVVGKVITREHNINTTLAGVFMGGAAASMLLASAAATVSVLKQSQGPMAPVPPARSLAPKVSKPEASVAAPATALRSAVAPATTPAAVPAKVVARAAVAPKLATPRAVVPRSVAPRIVAPKVVTPAATAAPRVMTSVHGVAPAVVAPRVSAPPAVVAPKVVAPAAVLAPQVVQTIAAPAAVMPTSVAPAVVAPAISMVAAEAQAEDLKVSSQVSAAAAKPEYDPTTDVQMKSFYGFSKPHSLYGAPHKKH